jgi:anti-anti-sigma factor
MTVRSLSYSYDMRQIEDGILVRVRSKSLNAGASVLLMDDLAEAAQQSGLASLYLDLREVEFLSSEMFAQLVVLDRQLRNAGGRLALFNLNPLMQDLLQASCLTGLLDVRAIALPEEVG